MASPSEPYPVWAKLLRLVGFQRPGPKPDPREVERELQVTIDTIPVLVARHRRDGTCDFGNKQLRDYLGPDVQVEEHRGHRSPG